MSPVAPGRSQPFGLEMRPQARVRSNPVTGVGAIAQLGERLLCKQEVVGSIPSGSTSLRAKALRLGWPATTIDSVKAVVP